jgi:hypothetical protein
MTHAPNTPPTPMALLDTGPIKEATPEGADTAAHHVVLADLAQRLPHTAEDDADWPEACRAPWLQWMIAQALAEPMALDKLARWTGYIQGVATARGWLDVATERARTRPVFHAAAERAGRPKPPTIGTPGDTHG